MAPQPPDAARAAARAAAASAAAELVEPGATIGLGSGRAVWAVTELLGQRGDGIRAAVGSSRTDELARRAGLEVVELDGSVRLSLAIDGADEVDPQLGLLKGGGGALLREKIVVTAADRFVVVAETAKRVDRLGSTLGIPVEVVRFAWRDTRARLLELVESAELRRERDTRTQLIEMAAISQLRGEDEGEPFVTDEGHHILDCAVRPDADIGEVAAAVKAMPGVVEHGLFLTEADLVLLGTPEGQVERLSRD